MTSPWVDTQRRRVLRAAATLPLAALPVVAKSAAVAAQVCSSAQRLFLPGDAGYLGRVALRGRSIAMSAGIVGALPRGITHGPLAFRAHVSGRDYRNPTLVLAQGERVRIRFDNRLAEPSIVHWHGLTIDSANDGSGIMVAQPGDAYDYDFEVRNRGGLYWYHPHPHGRTAGQVYDGLYGALEIEDADDARLRSELDLAPGRTEWLLVLQDRRPGSYAPIEQDRMHGYLGSQMFVNGTACAFREVQTRVYRLRLLNACNARTLRLAFRSGDATVPFLLIGTDCGLLRAPIRCTETFFASAERLDILLDLRDASAGDRVRLESLAFDPMHGEMDADAPGSAAAGDANASSGAMADHAAMHHDHAAMLAAAGAAVWPEGERRVLLELRVDRRTPYQRPIPGTLSALPPIANDDAQQRSFRLGFNKGRWRINDKVYAMGETPIELAHGSRETWLIRNYYTSMPHAMHLHGFQFDVLEREGSPDPVRALVVDDRGRLASDLGRKDTVLVWPGESVRLAFDFTLPFPAPQTYVFHCHNLEHEDGGMMLGVKVA